MNLTRLTAVVITGITMLVSGYFVFASFTQWKELPDIHSQEMEKNKGHAKGTASGGAEKSGEHVASATGGAEAPPAESSHGAPPAEGSKTENEDPLVVVLDEFFLNLGSEREPEKLFSLGIKLELQLFEGADSSSVRKSASGIRHTIIETSRVQDYFHLKTTSGKLYFKELLIKRINAFLNAASVRDVRFAALLFQR